jgi:hypothetical protein
MEKYGYQFGETLWDTATAYSFLFTWGTLAVGISRRR